jgi:dTDP-4-amino-4,6-dideoxygalactose transaminase
MNPGPGEPLIPLFDISLDEGEIGAVADTLRSGWLTMGPRIREFEIAFAEHLDIEHAIATSSCTAALHLAYLAAGIGPGDEVIVPAITFVASAAAVRYCGATPVFADIVSHDDLNVDPADVEARVTPRTKAICAVHYAGFAADLEALQAICDRHGLTLIEDAAHAPSATGGPEGRKLGTQSLAGCFSFFSNKVLSCGEGGLLATDDERVAELVRSRRSHAMTSGTWDRHRGHSAGYDVVGVGYNYRMDEPRAALLSARLPKLETDIARRQELVHRYRDLLAEVDGVTLPFTAEAVDRASCYVMPIMLEDGEGRNELRESMLAAGVQTSVLYPAIHEFTAYAHPDIPALPQSEEVARCELTLPLFPSLTERDQDRVIAALKEGLAKARTTGMAAAEGVTGRGDG